MDVLSLLNSHPAATERQERPHVGDSMVSSRSRTPWDAGGYSLPIHSAKNGAISHQQHGSMETRHDDALISTPPPSPKHRSSDSRSSLSSFTSSQSTTTHSRYSSTSTLNSNSHTFHKGFGIDTFPPEIRSISQALVSVSLPLASASIRANGTRRRMSLSPIGSPPEQVAFVAENHLIQQQTKPSIRDARPTQSATARLATKDTMTMASNNRPGSPSDAILIKRRPNPSLRVDTEDLDGFQQKYSKAPLQYFQPSHLHNKPHKRTLSEPSFRPSTTSSVVLNQATKNSSNPSCSISSITMEESSSSKDKRNQSSKLISIAASSRTTDNSRTAHEPTPEKTLDHNSLHGPLVTNSLLSHQSLLSNSITAYNSVMSSTPQSRLNPAISTARIVTPLSLGPTAEPTPPSSQHPDHASPTPPPAHEDPATPETIAQDDSNKPITCEYVENCDTGSQMRKAISHIFGRNKMCTRQIPQNVWVHYCRKHYQRSRYRNPKEYTKTQCGLVLKQIRQIHKWYELHRSGHGNKLLLRWTLAIRKREKQRIEDLERKGTNKRKRSTADADDEEEEEEDFGLGHGPVTAVPEWLQAQCGTGYPTSQVLEIFTRLETEVWDGLHTTTFPDVEVLPELAPTTKEPKSPKGYVKTRATPPAHRRSQSLGVPPNLTAPIGGDEPPVQSQSSTSTSMENPPFQKRRRPNTSGQQDERGRESYQYMARSRIARPMDGLGHMQSLVHRPMYTHPEEYAEQHRDIQPRYGGSPYSLSTYQAPLPAPAPVHNTSYTIASRLEDGGDFRRPTHNRSQSEFVPSHGHPVYLRSPPDYSTLSADARTGYGHPIGHPVSHFIGYLGQNMDHSIGQPARAESHEQYSPRQYMSEPPRSETEFEPYPSQRGQLHNMYPYHPGHGRHQSTPMLYPSSSSYKPSSQRPPHYPVSRVTENEPAHNLNNYRH
ncbi:hypothetical protein D0Z07_9271 [Hyphodiscus hymeniophilus]|uniref:Uncharacterized protein n=1 Tax=Hyphodiscus hymeniophilus TaxID=353542 RepID=A0A9P6VDI1_9HELO|nr:hypothetical protein D0Z07_9271 [Hyphodiscus hymeniophilus]